MIKFQGFSSGIALYYDDMQERFISVVSVPSDDPLVRGHKVVSIANSRLRNGVVTLKMPIGSETNFQTESVPAWRTK